MNETEFAAALHACLDAHRDPLDDPALCTWLAEHPEQLPAFAALRELLAALPAMTLPAVTLPAVSLPAVTPDPRIHRGRRAPLRLAGAAAIAAAVLVVAWPRPAPASVPVRGILAATLEEHHPSAGAAVSFTLRQGWNITPGSVLETYEMRSQSR